MLVDHPLLLLAGIRRKKKSLLSKWSDASLFHVRIEAVTLLYLGCYLWTDLCLNFVFSVRFVQKVQKLIDWSSPVDQNYHRTLIFMELGNQKNPKKYVRNN